LIGHFPPIVSPFADRGLSRYLAWGASGDERGKLKSGVSTISLGRLQYIRWVTAGHTQKTKTKDHGSIFSISVALGHYVWETQAVLFADFPINVGLNRVKWLSD
jgi:hypothetical protein